MWVRKIFLNHQKNAVIFAASPATAFRTFYWMICESEWRELNSCLPVQMFRAALTHDDLDSGGGVGLDGKERGGQGVWVPVPGWGGGVWNYPLCRSTLSHTRIFAPSSSKFENCRTSGAWSGCHTPSPAIRISGGKQPPPSSFPNLPTSQNFRGVSYQPDQPDHYTPR